MAPRESELLSNRIEVSLDGRQVFFLFFGGAVIATLVFILGVMVGRRVEGEQRHLAGDLERNPLAALDQLELDHDFAFPSSLRGEKKSLGEVDKKFSQSIEAARLSEKSSAAVQASAVPTTKTADFSVQSEGAVEPNGVKAAPSTEDKVEVPREVEVKPTPAISNKPPTSASERSGRFTLQLGSFQSKKEAEELSKTLRSDDFKPYIATVDLSDKGVWYRVRLGSFDSYEAAIDAKESFEQKKQIIAYVTRLKK